MAPVTFALLTLTVLLHPSCAVQEVSIGSHASFAPEQASELRLMRQEHRAGPAVKLKTGVASKVTAKAGPAAKAAMHEAAAKAAAAGALKAGTAAAVATKTAAKGKAAVHVAAAVATKAAAKGKAAVHVAAAVVTKAAAKGKAAVHVAAAVATKAVAKAKAAVRVHTGPDLVGRLQFPFIDMGKGEGQTYLKANGHKTTLASDIKCPGASDQCNWKYTQSNHSFMALQVKDPTVCDSTGTQEYSCCLKWEAAAKGSGLSVVKCDSCTGNNCQWCLHFMGEEAHGFRPKEAANCTVPSTECLAADCTCIAGKTVGGETNLQPPGNVTDGGSPVVPATDPDCRMEWVTAT